MPAMESAVAKLNAAPFRSKIKVMVGGAPIDEKFAEQIGADGYAVDAATAAEKAKQLVS
jgi:5-methyltetrahydrofolate--homocysteine methyltransferase